MSHRPLDELMAAAAVVTDDTLANVSLDGLDDELEETIMSTPLETIRPTAPPAPPPPRRRRRRLFAGVAAVVIAAAAVVVAPFGDGDGSAWAAEVVEIAEASPRLLVDLAGWEVVRADSFTVDEGEMTFSDGERALDVRWRPGADHEGLLADRAASADTERDVTVNGKAGTRFRYEGSTDFTTVWREGRHSFEARGDFPDEDAYAAVVAALSPTDVDTWLTAMPESVVRPDARAAAVTAMLEGVPLPDGFDHGALPAAGEISDGYQLGARVVGAVACAWIEQWLHARSVGDTVGEAEALAAMQTARDWPVLQEMTAGGAYPEVVWEYADAMEQDGTLAHGATMTESYAAGLGCAGTPAG